MSKRNVRKSSYVLFERKMTRKMLSLVLISIGAVFLLRELIRGRFGDSVVAFLTGVFHLDYSDALYILSLIHIYWGPYMRQDLATAKCANPRKISDQQT